MAHLKRAGRRGALDCLVCLAFPIYLACLVPSLSSQAGKAAAMVVKHTQCAQYFFSKGGPSELAERVDLCKFR